MDVQEIIRGYERRMDSALRKRNIPLYMNIRKQLSEFLARLEHVPAKTITDTMSEKDRELSNRLIRKVPILADILESSAMDLLEILKKYDNTVTLPMLEDVKAIKEISKGLRETVDRVNSNSFSVSFGDTCDNINELIEDYFNKVV